MSQKPDSTKIDAALKRAAYKALHGTREERSGRFLPGKKATGGSSRRVTSPSKAAIRNR
jgi:hypothetical protein